MALYEEKESYAASRSNGVGGTDAAAILGFSPWKKPIQVWEGKINPGAQPELDKEQLFWGSALEPIVRERYALSLGVEVTEPSKLGAIFPNSRPWRDSTLIIGREPWMLGAPDGWKKSDSNGVEIKCSSRRTDEWGQEGSDTVPTHYFIQVSWYMAVCEANGWDFATLFSGSSLEYFHIKRDLDFERDMMDAVRSFWFDNVLKQIEPAIDESESYGKYLARKFSLNPTGAVITHPSGEILDWADKMKIAEDQERIAAADKQLANNHLRALIGDAKSAATPLGTVGWVRPQKKDSVNWEEVGKAVGPLHPEIMEAHTRKDHAATPYLRAWWSKKANGSSTDVTGLF